MYSPANQCIYCGRTSGPLSKEHIVPLSLGGNMVLPKASCPEHAKVTSALEIFVARQMYGAHRAHEQTKSRRRNSHTLMLARTVPVTGIDANGITIKADVKVEDLPRFTPVILLGRPVLFGGPGKGSARFEPCDKSFQALMAKLKCQEVSLPSPIVHIGKFQQLLAKIGHAYACAEVGLGQFTPCLLPVILGAEPWKEAELYVGGFEPEQLQDPEKQLRLRELEHEGTTYLVVEVSLHFYKQMPRYQVICGTLP